MKSRTAVEIAKELITINSVNPFRTVEIDGHTTGIGNERAICLYIEDFLRRLGFEIERQIVQPEISNAGMVTVPERWNVIAQKGNGEHALLLFGHTDTVDVKKGWETDPFTPTEKVVEGKKRIYGLGACDMRAGLGAILAAAQSEVPEGAQLKLAFSCDEEYWSFGADMLVKSDFIRNVKVALSPDIAAEAGEYQGQWLGVGRLGRLEYEINIAGVACHGAAAFTEPSGLSALYEAARLAVLLEKYALSLRREFRHENIQITNSAYLNRMTSGEGMLSVPDSATLIFDRTFLPNEDPEGQVEELKGLIRSAQDRGDLSSRAKFTIQGRSRPTPPCKPYIASADDPAYKRFKTLIESQAGECCFGIAQSVADENRIAERGIPTFTVSPIGADLHSPNEWVDILSVERVETLLRACVARAHELVN